MVGLSSALVEDGHDLELWQTHNWSSRSECFQEYLQDHGVKLITSPVYSRSLLPQREAFRKLVARDVDLVHFHSVFNVFNNQLSRYLRTPYVVTPHGGYSSISLARRPLLKQLFKWTSEFPYLRRSALLLALTEIESQDIRNFGYQGPVTVVPNGIKFPCSKPDPLRFRAWLGIKPDVPLALYVGRPDCHQKRVDKLISAIAETTDWHLAIVSSRSRMRDERELRKLKQLVEAYGISTRVKFFGPLQPDQVRYAYQAATVFTLISRWEGLPMTLLEALSFGLPAVVSMEVESILGVAAAEAGWSTKATELGATLTRLQDVSEKTFSQKSSAGKKLAGHYTQDRIAERYEKAVASVLEPQL